MTPSIDAHQDRWRYVRDGRAYWTREARTDLRYLAGKTWSADEQMVFASEDRRPTNYNIILPKLHLVAGIEAMNRQDLKVLPRARRDVPTAEALTKILKFVSDQNALDRQLSRSFRDTAGVGLGWLEVAQNPDPEGESILIRRRSPFDIWVDPACREPDLSDARDVFRAQWVEWQILAQLFPEHAAEISGLVGQREEYELSHSRDYTNSYGDRPPVRAWQEEDYGQDFEWGGVDTTRGLVRAVERWYRVEQRVVLCRMRDGRVLEVGERNLREVARHLLSGEGELLRAIIKRMRVAIFAGELLLQDAPSPYSHRQFPFVPMWGYEDEEGRPMGLVRQDRDPQKEFTARRTSALKKMLMRQLWYEKGAFTDVDQAIEAIGRHDGVIEVNPGYLANKVLLKNDLETARSEVEMAEQARMMVQDWAGATKELAGQHSNATSGVAIQSRQSQGQAALFTLYDSRNWAQQRVGELALALVQDLYTQEQAIRITESRKGLDWVVINQRQPDGTVLHDITQGKYDVVVSEMPTAAINRTQQLEALASFLAPLPPEVKLALAPDLAELADLPNAEEVKGKLQAIVDRLLGMGGPGQVPPGPGSQESPMVPGPMPGGPGGPPSAPGTAMMPEVGPLAPEGPLGM